MSLHDVVTRWWNGELGAAGTALDVITTPAEILYRSATNVRNALYDNGTLETVRLTVPVISIGNVAVGGTGKTPVTAWLARTLRDAGARPAVLHGGYAADEPKLHAELNPDIPIVSGRDRVATGRSAIARGADVIVLDDAFQHRRLERDMDIVLIAAESWNSPHRALPRGPWREHADALHRAHRVVVTRRTASMEHARQVMDSIAGAMHSPVPGIAVISLDARRWQHDGVTAAAPAGQALLVAGIASPEAFRANAAAAGANVRATVWFPDHHDYTAPDAAAIMSRAAGGPIVTTAKDWVKLRSLLPPAQVWVLMQDVIPEDGCDALVAAAVSLSRREAK